MGRVRRIRSGARDSSRRRESATMRVAAVDISSELQVHSLRADRGAPCCSACRRRPLPGELVHVYDGGQTLCTLCVAALPAGTRAPVRSVRIHASERHLAVVSRAA